MVKQSSKPQTSKPRQSSKSQAPKPRPTQQQGKQQQGKQQQQDDQNTRLIERNQKTVNPILPPPRRGSSPVGSFTSILNSIFNRGAPLLGRRRGSNSKR